MGELNIKRMILERSAEAIRKYGYPNCTIENITTDSIYKKFLISLIEDELGNEHIGKHIMEIIESCN